MAIRAYNQATYKAKIKFEDNSTVGATFRLPRSMDYFRSAEGNTNKDNLMTFSNTCLGFDKPVDVELEDGTQIQCNTLAELLEYGVPIDITDVLVQWHKKHTENEKAKEALVKKSKSAGNSTQKATPDTNN